MTPTTCRSLWVTNISGWRPTGDGDVVIIDTAQGWVALNGLDARQYVTYDSDLRLMLPVGAFELTADNADLAIIYRERWL